MARKRPGVNAVRRVTGAVLFFLGLFVIAFGFGLGNLTVSLGGLALALLTFTPRLATMLRGTLRRWVVGSGRVVWVSDPPTATPYGRCQLELVVDAPGLPQEAVVIREPKVPVDQWPSPGMELPIEVAADDIRNVRILWPHSVPAEELDPLWDDDQPAPVPAGPPPSHLSESEQDEYGYDWDDEPASPHPHTVRAERDDDIDLDLDGPSAPAPRTPLAAGDMSPADEGRLHRHVPLPHEVRARVPSPRPDPATRRRPSPTPRPPQPPPEPPAPTTAYPSANPSASGAIHRVGVTLLVADVDRSAAFYRDRLGFHEIDSGPDSVVLASGETRLMLRAVHEMDPVHRRVAHLNLEVADIEAVYADLRGAGVKFTYPPRVVDRGRRLELWAAAFKDPDGHGVALTQWRPLGVGDLFSEPGDRVRQRP